MKFSMYSISAEIAAVARERWLTAEDLLALAETLTPYFVWEGEPPPDERAGMEWLLDFGRKFRAAERPWMMYSAMRRQSGAADAWIFFVTGEGEKDVSVIYTNTNTWQAELEMIRDVVLSWMEGGGPKVERPN
jgi:hypothetical protein